MKREIAALLIHLHLISQLAALLRSSRLRRERLGGPALGPVNSRPRIGRLADPSQPKGRLTAWSLLRLQHRPRSCRSRKAVSSMQWSRLREIVQGRIFAPRKLGGQKCKKERALFARALFSSKTCTLMLPILLVSCVHQPQCQQHCNGASTDAPVYGTLPAKG